MRTVSKKTIDFYVDDLNKRSENFILEQKRDTYSLYYKNKLILLNKNQRKRFKDDKKQLKLMFNLFAQVQKSINQYLKNIHFEVEKIEQLYPSTKNNHTKWNNMTEGEIFYYIDVKHCYWRISFLKGYISKRLYERVLMNESLKTARNMSLSLIVAPKKRSYFINGVFSHEIKEDKTLFQTIYNNIRFTSYNLMGQSMKLAKGSFIGYRTDGIMVTKRAVKKVSEFISDSGFNYTVIECAKIDANNYLLGDEKKKF